MPMIMTMLMVDGIRTGGRRCKQIKLNRIAPIESERWMTDKTKRGALLRRPTHKSSDLVKDKEGHAGPTIDRDTHQSYQEAVIKEHRCRRSDRRRTIEIDHSLWMHSTLSAIFEVKTWSAKICSDRDWEQIE
jgi:hypothetical protein